MEKGTGKLNDLGVTQVRTAATIVRPADDCSTGTYVDTFHNPPNRSVKVAPSICPSH